MEECQGNGSCLAQTDQTWIYSRYKLCKYNCMPIKCPNFIVCGGVEPLHIMQRYDNRCLECNILFGKNLTIKQEKQECPVCLDEREIYVQMPDCVHDICLVCFRRLHPSYHYTTNGYNSKQDIVFPEPEVIDEKYQFISYDDEEEYEEHEEEFLRKCPLCRQETVSAWM